MGLENTANLALKSGLCGYLESVRVEGDTVHLSGWAIDYSHRRLPQVIRIHVNGQLYSEGSVENDRVDVMNAFAHPAFLKSGFSHYFNVKEFGEPPNPKIQLYMVSQDGVVEEIYYPENLNGNNLSDFLNIPQPPPELPLKYTFTGLEPGKFRLASNVSGETIFSAEGKFYKVRAYGNQGHLSAYLDNPFKDEDTLHLSGWAADTQDNKLSQAVVIFFNSKCLCSGTTWVLREDVLKFYDKSDPIALSGFKFLLPLKVLEDSEHGKIRLFALWENGLATEFLYPEENIGERSGGA